MTRYVQHHSGHGARWPINEGLVSSCPPHLWPIAGGALPYLPKSEYGLVLLPTRWVDVSEDVTFNASGALIPDDHPVIPGVAIGLGADYRIRKVQLWSVQSHTNILGEALWAFQIDHEEPA